LCISVTAVGHVPEGGMVRRSGAQPGDRVYVTGTIGDAAAGLKLLLEGETAGASGDADTQFLKARHRRPQPNPGFVPLLREHASAAMDISDGLAADFAKLCAASGCGGVIDGREVPLSQPARALVESGFMTLEALFSGGDDYEILTAVPEEKSDAFERAAAEAGSRATRIGAIEAESEPRLLGKNGQPVQLSRPGYDHF
jgi:thiamine-monophosphate kinase